MAPGLVSRAGWFVWDDADTARWRAGAVPPGQWRWWDSGPKIDELDNYLFLPGRSYTRALADFAAVAGPMDLPPYS